MVNPVVDFSQYDNDHDGFVDCLLVIHAGSGAEFTYDNNDFHSHKWGIVPRLKDGVYVSSYTIQPEFWQTPGDMTIGVYAHELGHGFGLPDLYDTDYSSRGVGKWCLMSYGSWNGPNGKGGSPSHPCAWCLSQMGFATPTNITANTNGQIIPPVEATGQIYRLWNSGNQGNEYFLVENRQKMLSDTYLPGEGLLIWHIDESKSGNTQEWYPTKYNLQNNEHYLVALEQADGLYQLEDTSQPSSNYGDAGDPYPGNTNKTTFDAVTNPSSDSYTDGTSFVSVNNISVNGDTIQADLLVGFSAGVGDENAPSLPYGIELAQNYPNPFNPSTIISLSAEAPAKIKLDVFNTLGQHVKTLFDGVVGSGVSEFEWDGRNEAGHQVASGVYFYRLSQEGHVQTRRMVMLK
jgi:immune inhibitor A